MLTKPALSWVLESKESPFYINDEVVEAFLTTGVLNNNVKKV